MLAPGGFEQSGTSKRLAFLVISLLTCHAALVMWLDVHLSPNVDEPAHLAAGVAMWQYGSFELYCVNPPLMRAIATLPILFMTHEDAWGDFDGAPKPRPEFVLGAQFVESHPEQWERFLVASRLALLPFTIVGGLFCFLWGRELFGWKAGLLSLTLWCFSPNILTWSSFVCTDGVAASMGIGAAYFFWRWLRRPTWSRAMLAGLLLGLAQLSKMTLIVLFVVWPVLWVFSLTSGKRAGFQRSSATQLSAILLLGLYVLNLGYAFDGSFTQLGNFEFHSQFLRGENGSNRFHDSWLSHIPMLVPRQYLIGIDLQKVDFEKGMPSYLFGRWSDRGWWYYYLVGLALKVPLGTWCLGLLAVASLVMSFLLRSQPASAKPIQWAWPVVDLGVPLITGLAIVIVVSLQDGFSKHFRYVLPAIPFAYILIGQVANLVSGSRPLWSVAVLGSLIWSLASSLSVYPHTMSYFNELVGGPVNGHHFMLGSSFSWSQDQFYLREWLSAHPEVDSPYMQVERSVSLERLGLRSRGAPPKLRLDNNAETRSQGPVPGWHVMCLQHIHDPDGGYLYFLQFDPVVTIGRSICIYHIKRKEANRVRHRLNLAQLPPQHSSPTEVLHEMRTARDRNERIAVALLLVEDFQSATSSIEGALRKDPSISVTLMTPREVRLERLGHLNVFVAPGGKASEQGGTLGVEGREAIRDFVRRGGGYVGICAGAYLAATNHDWSLNIVNARTDGGSRYVPGHGNVNAAFRGWGKVDVELVGAANDLFSNVPRRFVLDHTGGPILSRANDLELPDYAVLACFRSELWKYPFQQRTMIDSPAIVASRFGNGHVLLFSPHPENASGLESMLIQGVRACAASRVQER